jgi:small subunit ribosomal protein S14
MAKTSTKYRNTKRQMLVAKYATKRAALKAVLADPKTTDEDFFKAQRALARLPRNSSAVRLHNRCQLTGRSRANIRKFGICRNMFRHLALYGKIPGVTKSSW